DKSRLYVTVFEGDEKEGLPPSSIALTEWRKLVAENHIVFGNKKDNFWEMGDTGPCGPCTEIHVDMRPDNERAEVAGRDLVNKDHPQVIEIWNNVFMQFNRLKDGTLQPLPAQHVDTGMGFERLVRVIQGKTSNYDTDVFTGTIAAVENITNKKYDYSDSKQAIAFRVIADHIRAISFTIADGQLPSNTGADKGLKGIDDIIARVENKTIAGKDAFELFDTYGFPIDLTRLIAQENNLFVDEVGFEAALKEQKDRSRAATAIDACDWIVINTVDAIPFVGYTQFETTTNICQYRKVTSKGKEQYQIVLAQTPFYAESGGQVGDKGKLGIGNWELEVVDTKKENGLTIHFVETLPEDIDLTKDVIATVNTATRIETSSNHSATHLLHAALRKVLGTHVAQKGSLVNDEHLRFDFSHFAKVTDEEIAQVEAIVNEKIRENIPVVIKEMNKDEAVALGAMALFGEKYGDMVRVVIIDAKYSIELCGGTHIGSTGELGFFKIKAESAVAAGVRRIEAVSGKAAEAYINNTFNQLSLVKDLYNNPKELIKQIENSIAETKELKKKIESLEAKQLIAIKAELLTQVETINGSSFIGKVLELSNADGLKKLASELITSNDAVVLASNIGGKASVAIALS
ncbi:unnamed protein product, partial [Rotaria sp. Silwood1]